MITTGRWCSQAELVSPGDSLGGSQGVLWVSPNLEQLQVARDHKLIEEKNFQAETLASTEDKMCFDYGLTSCHKSHSLEGDMESIITSYQKLAMRTPGPREGNSGIPFPGDLQYS